MVEASTGLSRRFNAKEVRAIDGEHLQFARIGEIQAAGHAGQQHAQRENVRQFVVMADRLFPGAVIRQENRLADVAPASADPEIGNGQRGLVNVRRAPRFADHLNRLLTGDWMCLYFGRVLLWRADLAGANIKCPAR